jgi:hypothetical protein
MDSILQDDEMLTPNGEDVRDISSYKTPKWIRRTAQLKQDMIWEEIEATKSESAPWPGAKLAGIFVESMKPSFNEVGDTMPVGLLGKRQKYIHTVGAIGKVKFVSAGNHPYTGIFKGANHGFARFSSAVEPTAKQALAPGMGLKFLRSGADSANLVAMFSVDGQPNDWNFFSNSFVNHIPAATTTAPKALSAKFAGETKYIQEVGLSDMSAIDENGTKVASPVFPFSLRYEPHSDVHTLFPTKLVKPMSYMTQLQTVPANSRLYKVYAFDKPAQLGGKESLIGTLQLDGSLTQSRWGDDTFYIRHQKMDEDLAIHSNWTKYTDHYGKGDSITGGCPYLKALQEKVAEITGFE